jgi:hypothetical protein
MLSLLLLHRFRLKVIPLILQGIGLSVPRYLALEPRSSPSVEPFMHVSYQSDLIDLDHWAAGGIAYFPAAVDISKCLGVQIQTLCRPIDTHPRPWGAYSSRPIAPGGNRALHGR